MSPALNQPGFFTNVLNLLDNGTIGLAVLLMALQIGALICSIFTRFKGISGVVAYVTSASIINSTYVFNSGGHHLILMILFFLIFINEENTAEYTWRNAINRGAFLAIQIQVCLMYFISALFKLTGESWVEGTAMWQSIMIHEYSWIMSDLFSGNNGVLILGTWFLLIYQLSFPILIWLRPLRKWILLIGVGVHLFIAVGMGLFNFGLAMMVAYSVFMADLDSTSSRINGANSRAKSLAPRLFR